MSSETTTDTPPVEAATNSPPAKKPLWQRDPATNRITRDGVLVARFIDGVAMYESQELLAKYSTMVRKGLKNEGIELKAEIVHPEPVAAATVEAPARYGAPSANPADPYRDLTDRQREAILRIRRDQGWPDNPEAPKGRRPRPDALRGIKTDKYLTWHARYAPVEFAHEIGLSHVGKIRVLEKFTDPATRVEKRRAVEKTVVFAQSRTLFTEKLSALSRIPETEGDDE